MCYRHEDGWCFWFSSLPVKWWRCGVCTQSVPLFLQEIGPNAVFVEGTTGTTDICQGQLGESIRKPLSSARKQPPFIQLGNAPHSSSTRSRKTEPCWLFVSGNCWLLASLSCLTMHPTLFVKVVPPGQSLSEAYAGIFYFRVSLCGWNQSPCVCLSVVPQIRQQQRGWWWWWWRWKMV